MNFDTDFDEELLLLASYIDDENPQENVGDMFFRIWNTYSERIDRIDFKTRQDCDAQLQRLNNLKFETTKVEDVNDLLPNYIITSLGNLLSVVHKGIDNISVRQVPNISPNSTLVEAKSINYDLFPRLLKLKTILENEIIKEQAVTTWENKQTSQNTRLKQELRVKQKHLLQFWVQCIRRNNIINN